MGLMEQSNYKFVNATALQWLSFGVIFKMEFVAAINYVSGGALQRRYKPGYHHDTIH